MSPLSSSIQLAVALVITSMTVSSAHAEIIDTTLVLMPHCTNVDRSQCPAFPVLDPTTLTTDMLSVGDILDLDIVVKSPHAGDIETVRSWLTYDTNILEARSIELSKAVKGPLPGEQSIEKSLGLVKIGATVGGKMTNGEEVLARVTFRVLSNSTNTTLRFYHYLPGGKGETAINGKEGANQDVRGGSLPPAPCFDRILGCSPSINALLMTEPSTLQVKLMNASSTIPVAIAAPVEKASAETVPALAPASDQTTTYTAPSPTSAFTLLQIQNLRVTSRDRDIFVGWQALGSSELKGYNVYYSTVSGRYAQRHTLPPEAQSYTIRDLEPGTTYFIAVRGFNENEVESAFSQEVSVIVGTPESSTAPLTAVVGDNTPPQGNPVATRDGDVISGETGISSVIFMMILISSALGTAFAFHRQFMFSRPYNNV